MTIIPLLAAAMAPQSKSTNLYERVHQCVIGSTAASLPPGTDLSRVVVEPPRDPTHGDWATNAAMGTATGVGKKPKEIAETKANGLRNAEIVDGVDVAGPGFINLRLKPHVWGEELRVVLESGLNYGRSNIGRSQNLNIEFVSANPTGPMHVGHGRGAVFGDALANLLTFTGYDVTREYYINDAGAQVDVLARSAYLRYREALGENIGRIPEGLYPGDYLKPVGQARAAEHGDRLLQMSEARWLPIVREKAIAMMMEEIKGDLAALNIHPNVFFSGRSS